MPTPQYVVTVNGQAVHGPTSKEDADRYAEFYGGKVVFTW